MWGEATVKTHVGIIFTTIGVRNSPAAIVFAYHRVTLGVGPP
jgi:hypothetical protein